VQAHRQGSVLQQRHCAMLKTSSIGLAKLEMRLALLQTESEGKVPREIGETQPASIELRLAGGRLSTNDRPFETKGEMELLSGHNQGRVSSPSK
jgi:hypothetical protein